MDEHDNLDVARRLAKHGVPIFAARPDPDGRTLSGRQTGFILPKDWQLTTANPRYVDAWQPGMALCAVTGVVLDLVDADPRNGFDLAQLDGTMPKVYAAADTPSGGWHAYVKTLGVHSRDGVLPGLDVKAGGTDGSGRGFAFIAPTVRPSKVSGELVPYRWVDGPHLDALADIANDHTGQQLAELLRQARTVGGEFAQPGGGAGGPSPWDDVPGTLAEYGRDTGTFKLASALRGRGGWRLDDALAYMRKVVWPEVEKVRKDHPFTVDDFETKVRRAFEVYPDGGSVQVPAADSEVSDEFWTARPVLGHIHRFARARRVSPWAMLGVVLVRVAAVVKPFVVLPPLAGSYASLNTYIGLVGRSGDGKDAATDAAADAIDLGPVATIGTGSGEGIGHMFARYVKPTKDDPGGLTIHTESVVFTAAEVDTLTALKRRQASTLWPELRKAWTGSSLGFAYADKEKRLNLPRHSYRLGLVVGVQPERAGPLLDDADAGTPQRFLWLPAHDSDAPDNPPVAPEPTTWRPTAWPMTRPRGKVVLDVCPTARETIDAARLARLRRQGDALDGHLLLARLKVAALLDILDGRHEVTGEGWELAGQIMAVSDATRAGVVQVLDEARRKANQARGEAEADRAVIVDETREDASAKRVAGVVWRKLTTDWTTRTELRDSIAARDRRDYFEPAIGRLTEAGLIEVDGSGRGTRYRRSERSS